MRALVTGCAGFIGSHLTESLLSDGHHVVGIDCFNDNYGRPLKLQNLKAAQGWESFEFVPIDLARGELDDLTRDVDVIFHLAAEPGVRSSWGMRFETYSRNNVLATQCVLEAAAANPDVRVVYASSSSVYGDAEDFPTQEHARPRPHSPYGVTKLAAEHLALLYSANLGLDVVCLRYFSVYGPRQRPDMAFNRFCRAALTGEQLNVFGDGRQVRDFTYVDDVVAATRSAAVSQTALGGVYNVGGASQVSVRDAIEILEDLIGDTARVDYGASEAGDVRRTSADIRLATRDLGFQPRVGIREGLRSELIWTEQQIRSAGAPIPQPA